MHNRCWKTQRFQWELAPSSDAFKEQKEKPTYFGRITLKENNMIIKDQFESWTRKMLSLLKDNLSKSPGTGL